MKNIARKQAQTKICRNCGKEKPLSDFYKSRYWIKNRGIPTIKQTVHRNCKDCEREITGARTKKTAAKNAARISIMSFEDTQIALKKNYLRRKYGITLEQYEELLSRQNGGCAICGETQTLVVDHCHETGKVRGLLCGKHNSAIGFLNDSPEMLQKSIEYLNETLN